MPPVFADAVVVQICAGNVMSMPFIALPTLGLSTRSCGFGGEMPGFICAASASMPLKPAPGSE
eukprot:999106-Prymnesium_polylepis.1